MGSPRIVVLELASAQRIHSWREHCDDALALSRAERAAVDASGRFVWQLSSANHRAVARGYRAHESEGGALEEIAMVRERRDELVVRTLRPSHLPVFAWIATLQDETVVMSARAYSTVRDMRDSIAMARESLATATVGTGRRDVAALRTPAPAGRQK